mgnify:CR=1 FL=1
MFFVAAYPRDGQDAESLMRSADLAMYRAKAEGGAAFAFFEEHMDREALERVQLPHIARPGDWVSG